MTFGRCRSQSTSLQTNLQLQSKVRLLDATQLYQLPAQSGCRQISPKIRQRWRSGRPTRTARLSKDGHSKLSLRKFGVGLNRHAKRRRESRIPHDRASLSWGDFENVDQALTRKWGAYTQVNQSGFKRLIYCINLVAGVGFEPTTFRL